MDTIKTDWFAAIQRAERSLNAAFRRRLKAQKEEEEAAEELKRLRAASTEAIFARIALAEGK